MPELKRVIVAQGNRVAMEERLDLALSRVLESEVVLSKDVSPTMDGTEDISELGAQALKYYNAAKEYMREGNWAGYGRELEKLENILKQLSNTAGK